MDNLGETIINHVPETSFPSDHTTFMLSISITLLLLKETRKTGIILSILGIVGGLARVLCGIHYPFDIVGSAIVAVMAGVIIVLLESKLTKINQYIFSIYTGIANENA